MRSRKEGTTTPRSRKSSDGREAEAGVAQAAVHGARPPAPKLKMDLERGDPVTVTVGNSSPTSRELPGV